MTFVTKFAIVKKPTSYYLMGLKNMVLTLFLLVFVSNLNSTSFTKDFQQTGFVCEVDVDSDELNGESAPNFLDNFLLVCNQFGLVNNPRSIFVDLPVSGNISKSYTLYFLRKRPVVLHNLKLYC